MALPPEHAIDDGLGEILVVEDPAPCFQRLIRREDHGDADGDVEVVAVHAEDVPQQREAFARIGAAQPGKFRQRDQQPLGALEESGLPARGEPREPLVLDDRALRCRPRDCVTARAATACATAVAP